MEIQILSHKKFHILLRNEFWQLRKKLSQKKTPKGDWKDWDKNGRIWMMLKVHDYYYGADNMNPQSKNI
jgi:hypothetical protein